MSALWTELCPPPLPTNSYVEAFGLSMIVFGDRDFKYG